MTNFSKTLSVSIRCFGGARTPLWGEYNWNAFTWGRGFDVIASPMHVLGNSITPSEALANKRAGKLVGDSISPTSDATVEYLGDGNGYLYVFPSDETNAGHRDIPTYTSAAIGTAAYTSIAVASTTWS